MQTTTITLPQLQDAVSAAFADASPQAQGEALAAMIRNIDAATIAPAKAQPQSSPRRSVHATPKPAPTMRKRDWRENAPSKPQQDRIARAEEAILASGRKRGINLILREPARSVAMQTAGTASDYYKTLAAFTTKHGIKF